MSGRIVEVDGVNVLIRVGDGPLQGIALTPADLETLEKVVRAVRGVNIERDENGYPTEWGDL